MKKEKGKIRKALSEAKKGAVTYTFMAAVTGLVLSGAYVAVTEAYSWAASSLTRKSPTPSLPGKDQLAKRDLNYRLAKD